MAIEILDFPNFPLKNCDLFPVRYVNGGYPDDIRTSRGESPLQESSNAERHAFARPSNLLPPESGLTWGEDGEKHQKLQQGWELSTILIFCHGEELDVNFKNDQKPLAFFGIWPSKKGKKMGS